MKGLDAARALYLEKGAELIHTRFPEFEMRIAVGLAGVGSQCLGFDDDVSHDHDFEPGFCLWLTDADDDAIGLALSREMRGLFGGKVSKSSALGTSGVGVMRISDFYRRFTGCSGAPEAWRDWLHLPSYSLAQAVSGEVFRDDLGEFSRIRNEIAHGMPEDVRRKKLAARLAFMAQSGQYNYSRCLAHGEEGAAMLAVSEFVKNTAEAVFLLNRRHAPYYKWLLRGMRGLEKLPELADALEFLLTGDNAPDGRLLKAQVIEDICAQTVLELREQGLTGSSEDYYLERHAFDVQSRIENAAIRALHVMEG